jgi:hypothetical protein
MYMFLQVGIAESAMNGGGNPNVRKIEIVITPTDKMNTYKAVKLQLQIYACHEIGTIILFVYLYFIFI